jgi:hypothetical protein
VVILRPIPQQHYGFCYVPPWWHQLQSHYSREFPPHLHITVSKLKGAAMHIW